MWNPKTGDLYRSRLTCSGRCRNCKERATGRVCLNSNPYRPGAPAGTMSIWGAGFAGKRKYVMVPYADFNCCEVSGHGSRNGQD